MAAMVKCPRTRASNYPTSSTVTMHTSMRSAAVVSPNRSYVISLAKRDHVVRTSNELRVRDLEDLFAGRIIALRVPNFCSPKVITQAMKRLKNHEIIDYANAEGVGKFKNIGMAYFEAENGDQRAIYYQEKLKNLDSVRHVFHPYLSPIDKVRVMLDEQWPQGANLMNLGKGPMFAGLIRAIKKEILPHEDKLERDDPDGFLKISYITQLAFNCYMSIPKKEGGALQLWDKTLNDEEYNALRGNSYGIDRSKVGEPVITIRPQIGEFVTFNARYLHAVEKLTKCGARISLSGFIMYQGTDKPLLLWS